MQMRNAANVLPEPVGAEMSVGLPARIGGQPCSCGSVGVSKRRTNHSWTTGCAQARLSEIATRGALSSDGVGENNIRLFYLDFRFFFAYLDGVFLTKPLQTAYSSFMPAAFE